MVIIIRKEKVQSSSVTRISRLPEFTVSDINGRLLKSDQLLGKNLYVQFIDPRYSSDLAVLRGVHSAWKNEDIQILGIVKNVSLFKRRYKNNYEDIIISNENFYEELLNKFKEDYFGQFYYIFDNRGKIVSFGNNDKGYNDGPKIHLKKLISKEYFLISDFIPSNIKYIKWLEQFLRIINSSKQNYYVFSLFTSICNGCASGKYVDTLNELFLKGNEDVYFACILNDKFNNDDIGRLRSQLKIRLPIFIADSKLSEKWNALIKEFREKELTNIIFISDNRGNIINLFDYSCNCSKQFFKFLRSLLR